MLQTDETVEMSERCHHFRRGADVSVSEDEWKKRKKVGSYSQEGRRVDLHRNKRKDINTLPQSSFEVY